MVQFARNNCTLPKHNVKHDSMRYTAQHKDQHKKSASHRVAQNEDMGK